jgi:hypothetical protein
MMPLLQAQSVGQKKEQVKGGPVARAPWNTALVIKVPTSTSDSTEIRQAIECSPQDEDNYYTTLIPYSSVAKHMTWRRLLGRVQEYVVVEHPLI